MSRYIDADALKQSIREKFDGLIERIEINSVINAQPTADVVDVVRCRDCTWWKSIFSWNGKEHKVCVREAVEPPRESDDYCSYGERREDDDSEVHTIERREEALPNDPHLSCKADG